MAVTMHDVAKAAGVSIKTVSNVINNYPFIKPDTRQRVLESIAELRYQPNLSARGLRSGRTGAVSLVIPDLKNAYFAELADAMIRIATERDLRAPRTCSTSGGADWSTPSTPTRPSADLWDQCRPGATGVRRVPDDDRRQEGRARRHHARGDQLPGFEIQDALVDLGPLGADEVKKNGQPGSAQDRAAGAHVPISRSTPEEDSRCPRPG